jgi:hypothetical protein
MVYSRVSRGPGGGVDANQGKTTPRETTAATGINVLREKRQGNVTHFKLRATVYQFFDTSPIRGHNFFAPLGHNTVVADGILASNEVLSLIRR